MVKDTIQRHEYNLHLILQSSYQNAEILLGTIKVYILLYTQQKHFKCIVLVSMK